MISALFSRRPSTNTVVFVRVSAFIVAMISIVLIPAELAAAAIGRGRIDHAIEIAIVFAILTLVAVVAARSFDPLRR